jgi:hypothetical protein
MDFWDYHGWGFIFCMFFVPRLTMLFATVWGGFWWWLGWFFAPRITVAILATMYFADQNIVLIMFTWLWALSGDGTEKNEVRKKYYGV